MCFHSYCEALVAFDPPCIVADPRSSIAGMTAQIQHLPDRGHCSTRFRPIRTYRRATLISFSSATAVSSPDLFLSLSSTREPVSGDYVSIGRIPSIFVIESLALSTSRASPASDIRSRNASTSDSVTLPTHFRSCS